ncbi:MAG: hypothetical protein GY909_18630 [Oligoflexia bacterium]|nr:hypothetical protein [Oligoflexia bacterium]
MKKLLSAIILLVSGSIMANTTMEIQCNALDLPYKNRFNLEGSIEIYRDVRNVESTRFSATVFSIETTNAGYNSVKKTFKKAVKGTLKHFPAGQFTKNEFFTVRGLPKDNEGTYINLALDYPGKFSSTIRTEDGREYKSQCKLIAEKTCLFGDTLGELEDSEKFNSKQLSDIFTQSRVYEGTKDESYDEGFKPEVARTVYTEKTSGREFTVYYTFDDQWDGGNTIGWIEDAKGNKVASIGDSDIYACKAF